MWTPRSLQKRGGGPKGTIGRARGTCIKNKPVKPVGRELQGGALILDGTQGVLKGIETRVKKFSGEKKGMEEHLIGLQRKQGGRPTRKTRVR